MNEVKEITRISIYIPVIDDLGYPYKKHFYTNSGVIFSIVAEDMN